GDSVIQHIIDGEVVLSYNKPQFGGGNVTNFDPKVKKDGKLISSGFIYLQSESHPIDFRKVELYDLEDNKSNPEQITRIVNSILNIKNEIFRPNVKKCQIEKSKELGHKL